MKIGIITLSASNNCGSMLQCYALKKILEKFGEVEIINFSSLASHRMYDGVKKQDLNPRHPRKAIKNARRYFFLKSEQESYNFFRKKYLGITGKELSSDTISKIGEKYDVIVCGSDQIWNVKMLDFDEAFFAKWAKCKKISYAPSLGGYDIREKNNYEEIVEAIQDFSALSVREEKGKKCLEELLGKPVEKVLDPTLTIQQDEWEKIIEKPIVEGEYIFFYSWAYCYEPLLQIVSEYSKKNNIPVYVIDARKWNKKKLEKWNYKLCKKEGPIAFLNLMYYAKKCYVESFHGMIFAYIFKKDFWLLDINSDIENMNTRLKELVQLLNVENRVLTQNNVKNKDQEEKMVYFENDLLREMRNKSLNYLGKALK